MVVAVLCALLMSGVAAISVAVPALAAARGSVRASAPAGHVTILVLDMSGSMTQNDPQGLRCSAANAYIDLSGPGDFVGVVGLDTTGGATTTHGFAATVDWGLAPRELSTVAARQTLRDAIATRSHNCAADASTPTYDALAKAEVMLATATQHGASGSVILLTDGIPFPNGGGQVSAIQQDLLPQFKEHNWPVDTVALGSDQSFHGFLSGLSSATSGSFYDDGHGVVPGVSPLNITPFFLEIFRVRNNRSPGPDLPPTALEGGITARNFSVGAYVSHLDIVVVKDDPNTRVSLVAPNGQRFPPAAAGTFVSTDPHYAIFAVDTPQQGAWEVDLSGGSGQFLLQSLKVSTLALDIVAPGSNSVQALGQPFTLSARLSNSGAPVSGSQFTLSAHVAFAGGSGSAAQDVQLGDPNGSGTYSAPLTLPDSAPPGSYAISVTAHSASEDVITTQRVVRFELFPTPVLYTSGTTTPAIGDIHVAAVTWDPLLGMLYRLPLVSALGGWALDGHPAQSAAVLHGQVRLSGKPYSAATLSGTVCAPTPAGTHGSLLCAAPMTVAQGGDGAFDLLFPAALSGPYAMTLTTAGAFAQTHGDLTHVQRVASVSVGPAGASAELRAWAITLFYLLLLLLLVLLVRYGFAQKPFGALAGSDGGQEFARARRAPWSALLHPGRVSSRQMGMDTGVQFLFRRGGRILVRGVAGSRHFELAGRPVPLHPIPAAEAELTYSDGADTLRYVIRSRSADAEGDDDESPRGVRGNVVARIRGARPDEFYDADDDDDDDAPRRGGRGLFARRRGRGGNDDDDDDVYSGSGGRSARFSSRGRRSSRHDDDDDAPRRPPSRRSGRRDRYDDDL
ncbi:MAG: hypothetical protein ACHQ4H_01945 [Ktedonobacterales bacterium]